MGGNGGGLARLSVTRRLKLNGTIRSDGSGGIGASAGCGGGGAGGGIYIRCRYLEGTNGVLSANGGINGRTDYGGGGGGGRIALWRLYDHSVTQNWTITVAGGAGVNTGEVGTVYWGAIPESGTVFSTR